MKTKKVTTAEQPPRKTWRRRIWGIMPTLFLIGLMAIIVMLFFRIKSEKEILAAEKVIGGGYKHRNICHQDTAGLPPGRYIIRRIK